MGCFDKNTNTNFPTNNTRITRLGYFEGPDFPGCYILYRNDGLFITTGPYQSSGGYKIVQNDIKIFKLIGYSGELGKYLIEFKNGKSGVLTQVLITQTQQGRIMEIPIERYIKYTEEPVVIQSAPIVNDVAPAPVNEPSSNNSETTTHTPQLTEVPMPDTDDIEVDLPEEPVEEPVEEVKAPAPVLAPKKKGKYQIAENPKDIHLDDMVIIAHDIVSNGVSIPRGTVGVVDNRITSTIGVRYVVIINNKDIQGTFNLLLDDIDKIE